MAAQWYIEYDDGRKYGPVTVEEARKYAQDDAGGYAWTEGFSGWKSISEVVELTANDAMTATSFSPPSRARGKQIKQC